MKRLALFVAFGMVAGGSAMAQGTIDFHNPNSQALMVTDGATSNKLGAAGSVLGPASTRVGLWVGPNGSSSFSQLIMVGMTTNSVSTSALFQGTFNGGNPFTIDTALYPNGLQGNTVAFGFIAWSDFSTLNPLTKAPTTGYMGQSLLGQGYVLAGGTTSPNPTFGTAGVGQGQVLGFVLTPVIVPEPTTLALAGIGLAGLLIFRRRS